MSAKKALIAGVFALTAGCTTTQLTEAVPPNYREMVAAEVKKTFFDPYSIRDAAISNPIPGTSMMGSMHTVCVRANAKNRMGGYTGLKETAFVFRGGAITAADQQYGALACSGANYEPFSEINAGSQSGAATGVRFVYEGSGTPLSQ